VPVARRNQDRYGPLTPRAAWQLAAPPSWVASIGPVLVGGLMALLVNSTSLVTGTELRIFGFFLGALRRPALSFRMVALWVLMLVCAVAAQSAANALNDYKDFVAGTDTEENCTDATDASIIYNRLEPKSARDFGIACLIVALAAGIAVSLMSTPWLLLLGAIGAVALLSYSYGPVPVSYLPLGELVSGLTFGLLIAVATFIALTGYFNWLVLLPCIQQIISIALIMMTNNICDIERDQKSGRHTLPVLLGRKRALTVLAVGDMMALASLVVFAALLGWLSCIPVLIACVMFSGLLPRFSSLHFDVRDRPQAMAVSMRLACLLGAANVVALLLAVFWH